MPVTMTSQTVGPVTSNFGVKIDNFYFFATKLHWSDEFKAKCAAKVVDQTMADAHDVITAPADGD